MNVVISAPDQTITATLDANDVMVANGKRVLGEKLITTYLAYLEQGNPPNIKLKLETKIGSASIVRGIYELWRFVHTAKGMLTVTGYPKDYVAGPISLGITSLPGMVFKHDDV